MYYGYDQIDRQTDREAKSHSTAFVKENKNSLLDYIITYSIQNYELYACVSADHPNVALNEVPSACHYDCVNMIATIRSYPKHTSVIWKKGKELIDITLPKYAGSSDVGDRPVLCINNVKKEDGDVYTIEVQNALGKGTCNEELFVIGGKIRHQGGTEKNSQLEFCLNTQSLDASYKLHSKTI